ncbi:Arm DNA-binding domain-containing protein [Geobacter sp. FeAm09]
MQIRNAKPQKTEYRLFDGGGNLLVTPTGSKLWRMKYSYNGKVKQLSLGA